ncbi:MAG TPA: PRC-barrel domain-containing protein [Mycobacterium sp.]|nr:PRC-barrel domain-containing protein [Mycobacterium sp.]
MLVPDYDSLDGAQVTNEFEEKLGRVVGLFIDDASGIPTWVAVRSGLFGHHHSLVPLAQSRWEDGRLVVAYTADDLASAPHSDPDIALDAAEEQELFEHYNVGYSDVGVPGPRTGVEASDTGLAGTPEAGSHPVDFGTQEVEPAAVAGVPGLPTTDWMPRLRRHL